MSFDFFFALSLGIGIIAWRAGLRAGYQRGHLDAMFERFGHQPISRHGRRLHRQLTVYRGTDDAA